MTPGGPLTTQVNADQHDEKRTPLTRRLHQPTKFHALKKHSPYYEEPHYNQRRPHQSLGGATPATAWTLLEHTPATDPIPLAVLQAKASSYRQLREQRHEDLAQAGLTVFKTGHTETNENTSQADDQILIEVTRANRQVYYQGFHISLPLKYGGRRFYRTITDTEFLLTDPDTGDIVFSFPLPVVALNVRERYIPSYAIKGVYLADPTTHWTTHHAHYTQEFTQRQDDLPALFPTP